MDAKTLDQIAIRVASGTRRGLLRRIVGLTLGGGAFTFAEASEARRDHKHHDNDKQKKKKKKKQPSATCVCGVNQTCVDGQCVLCDVCFRECPFATVNQAVTASAPGSTIRICAGFFRSVTISKNVTLVGAGSQIGGTTLKGRGVARLVTVNPGVSAELVDLALDDGFSVDDGGACLNQGTLKMTNCLVSDSVAQQRGGGIFNASGASLTLVNTRVTGNAANLDGGGIFNDVAATVSLEAGSEVSGNAPQNCSGDPVAGCS
jgi:ferredoxin